MECTLSVIRQSSLILTGVAIPPLLMRIEKMKHITFENCCSNESVTEENRISFDNPFKLEHKYSPNIGNHKFSWFYVEDGVLWEKMWSDEYEYEVKTNIESIHQLPPNMLIGEIDELQQVMYAFGAGNFKLEY